MPGLVIRESAIAAGTDAAGVGQAGSKYGDALVSPIGGPLDHLCDEGLLHIATNPTPGTGIASLAAPTAYIGTKPFILMKNAHASKRLSVRWIKLSVTAAGTGGTAIHYAAVISGANSARYTSGGSTLAPVCPNLSKDSDTGTVIYCGAIVSVAPTSEAIRLLGHQIVRPVIPVLGDTYLFTFGGLENNLGGNIVEGTAIASLAFPHVPFSIGQNEWFAFHLWLPSQSAASSYEVEVAYTLR